MVRKRKIRVYFDSNRYLIQVESDAGGWYTRADASSEGDAIERAKCEYEKDPGHGVIWESPT